MHQIWFTKVSPQKNSIVLISVSITFLFFVDHNSQVRLFDLGQPLACHSNPFIK
jgi:hypothetical protein